MDHRDLIETTLRCWSVQDVESTVATFDNDVLYRLNVSAQSFGMDISSEADPDAPAIIRRGKDAARTFMYDLLADFDYVNYDPVITSLHDGVVRIHADYTLRHRDTGEELAGTKRYVIRIERGLIATIDEYVDAARFAAFVRLTKWLVAKNERAQAMETGP